jgi:hypothetical protein
MSANIGCTLFGVYTLASSDLDQAKQIEAAFYFSFLLWIDDAKLREDKYLLSEEQAQNISCDDFEFSRYRFVGFRNRMNMFQKICLKKNTSNSFVFKNLQLRQNLVNTDVVMLCICGRINDLCL